MTNTKERYEEDALEAGAWRMYLKACEESKSDPVEQWSHLHPSTRIYWIEEFRQYRRKSQVQSHVDDIKVMEKLLLSPIKESRVFSGLNIREPLALAVQVDGNHYKDMAIQPVEFNHANNIPFIEGSIIKYVCRHRSKNGLKDLEKAKHFIDLLIQLEYTESDLESNNVEQC